MSAHAPVAAFFDLDKTIIATSSAFAFGKEFFKGGMITRQDVVILISNSGETPELADMIAYARRFAIPLIGVAGRADSTLLRAADVALVLPAAPEACAVPA